MAPSAATLATPEGPLRRLLKILVLCVVLAVIAPFLLTMLYTIVNPPAMPVLRRELAGRSVAQEWVRLDAIAPAAVQAVIMAEDARFCLHYGVDLAQMRIVINDALEGGRPRGASTLTMQTVKNLFLWPQRDYLRKAVELPLAVYMDFVMRKRRIIEIYLNVAQFGPAIYGIEAAAQHYFDRPAAALTREQALALATTLPAPSVRDPRKPGRRQRAAMAHVTRELDRAPWVFTCLPEGIRP